MDTNLSLVIGGIALPVFAEVVLWLLKKVGVGSEWEKPAALVVALVFAILVVVAKFYPQYDPAIVGAISFIYTALLALQKVLPETKAATLQALGK